MSSLSKPTRRVRRSHLARTPAWVIAAAVALVAIGIPLVLRASADASLILGSYSAALLALLGASPGLLLLWRTALASRYEPVESPPNAELPEVTVIVPAFNEGRQVYDTIASIVRSDYPRDRLHVVAVDDGSSDDTWSHIERARRDFGTMAIRCTDNRGKRHALYEGFAQARGEVIVTVDSDSEVRPDTLRNLVAPIAVDPKVGAVAGTVRVLNRAAILPRMLDVSFTYSFEFIRASESVIGSVLCCPGALSAYRRSIIERVKDRWLAQRIFGSPANIGEDRALTNHVLRCGYDVTLQTNAVVYTKVPEGYGQLRRMLLRWARSNIRETLVLGSFVFTPFRAKGTAAVRLLFVYSALALILAGVAFVPAVLAVAANPILLAWAALGALLAGSVPSIVYAFLRRPDRAAWGLGYALLSTFALAWITPLALITPHRTGWLTRKLDDEGSAPELERVRRPASARASLIDA